MAVALATHGLGKRFGGLVVAREIDLRLESGARHALIGPNGAGKTTLLNLLTGYLAPTEGRIELDGEDITRLPQHQRARRGLVRTFQINQLFPKMTVLESVALAVLERRREAWGWWQPVGRRHEALDEAAELLTRLRLADLGSARTRDLAYGKQRLVEIALALALRPRVLLLDEPAAGVPGGESAELFETIGALPGDVTILLIEHDMDLVFRFAQRISVLVGGAMLVEGTPEAIAADPRVREVYLGEAAHG